MTTLRSRKRSFAKNVDIGTETPTETLSKSDLKKAEVKEKLAKKRAGKAQKAKFFNFLAIAIVLALVLGLPLGVGVSPKVGAAVSIGVIVLIFSYLFPRTALWAFLIYMPFGGTVTYWIAGGSTIFQVAKDAFYFPALLALIVDCRRRRQSILIAKNLLPTLSFLICIILMNLFFVNGPLELLPRCEVLEEIGIAKETCKQGFPFFQGVLGMKILIGYIPLMFCGYYLIDSKKTLLTLGKVLVILAIICCSLALVQYWYLKTGRCEGTRTFTGDLLYRANLAAKCFVGGSLLYSPEFGQIRLPGTFVSPWHWAWFLIANSAICYTVAFFETAIIWQAIGFFGMALVFLNAIICGQRIALGMVPIFLIIMLISTGQLFRLKRFIPIFSGFIVVIVAFVLTNPAFVQERIDSFVTRWNNSPPYIFLVEQMDWAVRNYPYYSSWGGLLGGGVGKATGSTRVLGSISFVETFHPKLIYEIGYLGIIAFMAFITAIIIYTFKLYRSLRDPVLKSFGSAFWVFILIIGYFPYWYPLDTDPVAIYYWLFAGILIKLPILDKEERQKEVNTILKNNQKFRQKSFQRLRKKSLTN